MSRVQLALNVSDIDSAVAFYEKFFGVAAAKRQPGYANFAIAEPPLKLVLIENAADAGTLNHLGVEVASGAEVHAAEQRLAEFGLATTGVDDTTCCYAEKTETWVRDPDGAPWEVYVKTGDADQMANSSRVEAAACCATDPADAVATDASSSCC